MGHIALPGEPFDATDVVMYRTNRRFIFVWRRADEWLVAIERGGFVYSDPIYRYRLARDGKADLVETQSAIPHTVCRIATQMIGR